MRRGLLTVAALLGVAISQAPADYVIIVANVGEKKTANGGGQGAGGGMAGMFGGPPGAELAADLRVRSLAAWAA